MAMTNNDHGGRLALAADRLKLAAAAMILRRLPFSPQHWGRLGMLGPPTHEDGAAYRRWARLGPVAVRAQDFPAWFIVNLGYWHQRHFYLTGRYFEQWITDWLAASLGPGDLFIDIGANLGFHTLRASHAVGPTGRVIGFEPHPEVFRILQGHVALNRAGNVELRQLALGDEAAPGYLSLSIPARPDGAIDGESALGSLGQNADAALRSVEVLTDSGDRQLADIPSEARGACKIDVEGWEMQVLRGMGGFIEAHPYIRYCVEITPDWLVRMGGASAEELVDFFRVRGFDPYYMNPTGATPMTGLPQDKQYDLVFMHRGSRP